MTRKTVESSVQQVQSHEDHWLAQWVCSLSVIIFLIAFGLSGQVLPRFVANQCTSEQGMCTPGECTCPFPLMKRDMVTQDAQACSQCVEEFCPAVTQGDSACSTSACECEDASWPRIDVGSPEKPCWQCVHPHKDMTLRGEDGDCLDLGQKPGTNRTCTIFRYTGAVMLDKSSGSSSCLTWSSDSWQIMPCQGSPDSSGKFTQRNSPDEDIFCTSRGKQCLHVKEYMCTADPSQCSTGVCRCEDPTHVRKEMQTVNGSACYLCSAPVRECPLFPEQCSSEPCECKPGFFKARPKSDEACFSCQPGVAPSAAGFTSLLGFLSAGATFLLCVALGVVVGCAIRRFIVGDPAPNARRRRRGSQPRSWSENCALYLEDAIQVVYERVGCWKPLKRVSWAVRKVVSLLDACDAALDPVYGVLEAGLDKLQHSLGVGVQKAKTLMGQADTGNKIVKTKKARDAREKDSRPGHGAPKEPLFGAAVSGAEKDMHTQESLSWDPINVNVNNQEWMNCVVPSLSAQRQSARYAKNDTLPPTSAVQRLRQRREAKAQAAEKATPPATVAEAEVDESWIDLMEQKEAKEKEAKEKAAAQRRERKHAAKARRAKVAAGFSPEADNEDVEDSVVHPAKKEKDSKAQGTSSQEADRLFSEAIHGMFLLATSDARREEEVDPEKPEDDEEDSDGVQKADSMDSQILPDKENFSPVPDKLANEDEDTPEVEDGWTKSCSSRSRVKRRGDAPERTFSGPSESGQMPSEQEPAAEPDPQQVSDDLRENAVAAAPDDLHETGPILSKRQKQRLRQRQDRPKVAKPKEEKPEAAVVPSKRLPFKEEQQQDVPDTSLAPEAAVEEVKPEAKAEAAEADAEDSSAEEENADVKPEEPKLVRSFADLVAGRPARPVEEEAESAFVSFKADAPEFVPMSMTTPFQAVLASGYAMAMASEPVPTKKSRRGRRGRKEAEDSQALPLTTVVIAEIANLDAQSLRLQLDACGFAYNFFYMPPERQEEYGNCAVVNFVDPSFVIMCQQFFEQSGEGNVSFFPIQGLDNNVAYWTSFGVAEDMINGPLVFPSAVAQWSEDPNMLNSKFSPQIKEQFHKTKLCVFNKKQKCSMGSNCPFAHSEEELQKAPDLTKTKLCYNFFRRKCNDSNCKFAHGYGELRATDTVFKTELCRWWANGSCKAGSSCRYAHGIEELRSNPNFTGMFGADFDLSEESMDFGFGFYPYLLEEQLASMAAEDGSADAGADADADAQMERSGSDGEVSEAQLLDSDAPSETLTSEVPGQSKIQRQQTAPPAVAFSKDDDNIILRIKGTFMEAVRIDEEMPLSASMRRSWSDGDLAQLCEAIESDSD